MTPKQVLRMLYKHDWLRMNYPLHDVIYDVKTMETVGQLIKRTLKDDATDNDIKELKQLCREALHVLSRFPDAPNVSVVERYSGIIHKFKLMET